MFDFLVFGRQFHNFLWLCIVESEQREHLSESVQYIAGYEKCRNEIQNFLQSSENVPDDVRSALIGHLQMNSTSKSSESTAVKPPAADQTPKSSATTSLPNILPRVSSSCIASIASSTTCQTTTQLPGNKNVFICNPSAPTYVLVPTATLCQPVPINSQMTRTNDSPLNLVKTSRTGSDIVTSSVPPTSTMQLGSVVNGNQFFVIPQGQISNMPNFMASSVGGQSNIMTTNSIQGMQGNFLCMPNLQVSLASPQLDNDVWRPWWFRKEDNNDALSPVQRVSIFINVQNLLLYCHFKAFIIFRPFYRFQCNIFKIHRIQPPDLLEDCSSHIVH